jgi:pyruvate dehydrogenase E2 component (dihydrolipoamide acetyltransferase)
VLAAEGATVAVGKVVALLADTAAGLEEAAVWSAGAAQPASAAEAKPAAEGPSAETASPGAAPGASTEVAPAPDRLFASPRARAQARKLGVDLAAAAAPGSGRLTEDDVLAMAAPSAPGGAPATAAPQAAANPGTLTGEIHKLKRARKIIAERMTLSATTVPQVTYSLRCDVTEAMALRRGLKSGSGGKRAAVSFDALIVRAAAIALTDFPDVNSQWLEGQGILVARDVNIAVAVDLEGNGLVIPVIHGADALDIRATAAELDRLASGARLGKLGPDDYAGGTFTITSLASLGVESFNPIVVPPQAAILGVGAIVPTPVFQQDQVVKRRMLALSLTTDHRILDGAPSARFLSRIRDLLEQPSRLGG